MTRTLLAASVAAVLMVGPAVEAGPTEEAGQSATGRPQFRTGVDLVAISVTVTDAEARYVRGLSADDFVVYEDSVPQQIAFFGDAAVPLDLAILLDTSASLHDQIDLVREAAAGFARTLRPGDRGMIIGFNSRVDVLAPFTGDVNTLIGAIGRTRAGGSTALYNAIYIALKELERLAREAAEVRRRAIVVLSDGEDTASSLDADAVLEAARRANTSIYTIGVAPSPLATQQELENHAYSEARYALKTLARDTGARDYLVIGVKELPEVYRSIAAELAHQYAIGYVSSNPRADGEFRRLTIGIPGHPGANARTRPGYFAPGRRMAADALP